MGAVATSTSDAARSDTLAVVWVADPSLPGGANRVVLGGRLREWQRVAARARPMVFARGLLDLRDDDELISVGETWPNAAVFVPETTWLAPLTIARLTAVDDGEPERVLVDDAQGRPCAWRTKRSTPIPEGLPGAADRLDALAHVHEGVRVTCRRDWLVLRGVLIRTYTELIPGTLLVDRVLAPLADLVLAREIDPRQLWRVAWVVAAFVGLAAVVPVMSMSLVAATLMLVTLISGELALACRRLVACRSASCVDDNPTAWSLASLRAVTHAAMAVGVGNGYAWTHGFADSALVLVLAALVAVPPLLCVRSASKGASARRRYDLPDGPWLARPAWLQTAWRHVVYAPELGLWIVAWLDHTIVVLAALAGLAMIRVVAGRSVA